MAIYRAYPWFPIPVKEKPKKPKGRILKGRRKFSQVIVEAYVKRHKREPFSILWAEFKLVYPDANKEYFRRLMEHGLRDTEREPK